MQVCVTHKVREYDRALGGMSKLKAEVPYDMSTKPPTPIMSRKEPWRPSTGSPPDSRKPDVVIVKDPTKPPTQDNIERIVEIKFKKDRWRSEQFEQYKRIAGEAPVDELNPELCGCPDPRQPVPQARELTATDAAEVLMLALVVLALVLDDVAPGGQLDDPLIPPLVARILDRLAPRLRPAPVVP